MPTMLGKKADAGPFFARSGGCETEFPDCRSQGDFYALLREACSLPAGMSDADVWAKVSRYWSITPDGFVKDPPNRVWQSLIGELKRRSPGRK